MISTAESRFSARASRISPHGVGLSVDLYNPDLYELLDALDGKELACDYLELFKVRGSDLSAARRRIPRRIPIEYHADGLWYCQPEFLDETPWKAQVRLIREQTAILGSAWVTHECATKQMVGYSFGNYLPPILSEASAVVAGQNAQRVQEELGDAQLLLIEIPPFTYFVPGRMDLARYFSILADHCECGILFDVGHLFTYYLYKNRGGDSGESADAFLNRFLERFPLERVIQIHLAGLNPRPIPSSGIRPLLDDHGALVPELLFAWMEKLLENPGLSHLKGVALEVDTKTIPDVLNEFSRLRSIVRTRLSAETAEVL